MELSSSGNPISSGTDYAARLQQMVSQPVPTLNLGGSSTRGKKSVISADQIESEVSKAVGEGDGTIVGWVAGTDTRLKRITSLLANGIQNIPQAEEIYRDIQSTVTSNVDALGNLERLRGRGGVVADRIAGNAAQLLSGEYNNIEVALADGTKTRLGDMLGKGDFLATRKGEWQLKGVSSDVVDAMYDPNNESKARLLSGLVSPLWEDACPDRNQRIDLVNYVCNNYDKCVSTFGDVASFKSAIDGVAGLSKLQGDVVKGGGLPFGQVALLSSIANYKDRHEDVDVSAIVTMAESLRDSAFARRFISDKMSPTSVPSPDLQKFANVFAATVLNACAKTGAEPSDPVVASALTDLTKLSTAIEGAHGSFIATLSRAGKDGRSVMEEYLANKLAGGSDDSSLLGRYKTVYAMLENRIVGSGSILDKNVVDGRATTEDANEVAKSVREQIFKSLQPYLSDKTASEAVLEITSTPNMLANFVSDIRNAFTKGETTPTASMRSFADEMTTGVLRSLMGGTSATFDVMKTAEDIALRKGPGQKAAVSFVRSNMPESLQFRNVRDKIDMYVHASKVSGVDPSLAGRISGSMMGTFMDILGSYGVDKAMEFLGKQTAVGYGARQRADANGSYWLDGSGKEIVLPHGKTSDGSKIGYVPLMDPFAGDLRGTGIVIGVDENKNPVYSSSEFADEYPRLLRAAEFSLDLMKQYEARGLQAKAFTARKELEE